MSYSPRPHMSAALAHLRLSVAICAIAVGLALLGQVAVWAMVHYTDARKVQVDAEKPAEPLRIIQRRAPDSDKAKAAETPPAAPVTAAPEPARVQVNTVPGTSDVLMRRMSALVQSAGILSVLLLSVLMFQAVMLSGASCVPGVEKVVTAASLTFIITLLCLPLFRFLPELPFRGIFSSYDSIVRDSEAFRAGITGAPSTLTLYGTYLLMPGALLIALLVVVLRFRAGVEAGIIITAVSELDEKLEREIRALKLGQLTQPRAVGALNTAMGHSPGVDDLTQSHHARVAPPAFRAESEHHAPLQHPGDSTKRPI